MLSFLQLIFALLPTGLKRELRVIGRRYDYVYNGQKKSKVCSSKVGKEYAYTIGSPSTAEEAEKLILTHFNDQEPHNCFIVLNSVSPDMMPQLKPASLSPKLNNKMVSFECTKADDVEEINALVLDLDRTDKSTEKLCASPEEIKQVDARRLELLAYLKPFGIVPNYQIFTGNGYQLGIIFDAQPKEKAPTVKEILQSINTKFAVDLAMADLSRVARIAGTWNIKSSRTEVPAEGRVHRKAEMLEGTENCILNKWADLLKLITPKVEVVVPKVEVVNTTDNESIARKFLNDNGIAFTEKTDSSCSIRFCLDQCLLGDHQQHPNESSIFIGTNGSIGYQCFHNTCKCQDTGKAWQEVKAKYVWHNTKSCENCGKAIYFEEKDGKYIPFTAETHKPHRCRTAKKVETTWLNEKGHIVFGEAAIAFLKQRNLPLIYGQSSFWEYGKTPGIWEFVRTEDIKKEIFAFLGLRYATPKSIKDILDLIMVETDKNIIMDSDPSKLCMKNGVLNTKNFSFGPHQKEYYQTVKLPFDFDATRDWGNTELLQKDMSKNAPEFTHYLASLGFEASTIARIQTWFGYCLTADTRKQFCLYLTGNGSNGKSVMLNILKAIVGSPLCSYLEPREFSSDYRKAQLRGKLLNIATEIETSGLINNAEFKKIVAGEITSGREIYQKPFDFKPIAKVVFAANDFLPTRDRSDAFFRRFDTLNFTKQFEGKYKKEDLEQLIIDKELPMIFNWAMSGLFYLVSNHWQFPNSEEFNKSKELFERESNPLRAFISDFFTVDNKKDSGNPTIRISTETFQRVYLSYCKTHCIHALSAPSLGREITKLRLGITKERLGTGNNRLHYYFGLDADWEALSSALGQEEMLKLRREDPNIPPRII